MKTLFCTIALLSSAWTTTEGVVAWALPAGVAAPNRIAVVDTARRLDVNQIVLRVANDGTYANDRSNGTSGLYFPKGSDKTMVFFASPWLVASVGGETRGAISQFQSEFGPGVMSGGTFTDPQLPQYHVYKVSRFRGDPLDTAHVFVRYSPGDPSLDPLLHHSWSEYVAGAAPYGAPVRSHRLPNTATPDPSDSVDVLGPDVLGDVMLWCVYNDADPALHTVFGGRTAPLGVEIQQSFYAFDVPGPLGNTVFLRLRIANRGANTLDSLLIGLWSDPDLGTPFDDVIGSDSALALAYCYNGHYEDNVYGATPPAIGYVLLSGPALLSLSGPFKGEERSAIQNSRNILLGAHTSGFPMLDPQGNPSRFWFSGHPETGTGWLDPIPHDRRLLLSVGPITMAPGDTQVVDAAIVIGQGVDNLASVANLRCAAAAVKQFYDAGFPAGATPGLGCPTEVVESCPRSVAFWQQQCAGGLSDADLTRLAQCADESADMLGLSPGMERTQFCSLLNAVGDIRTQALQEQLALLANVCAAKLGLALAPPDSAFLGPGIELWAKSVGARSAGQLAAPAFPAPCFCADSLQMALAGQPLSDPVVTAAYQELIADLRSVNAGIGLGPTCMLDTGAAPRPLSATATLTQVRVRWVLGPAAGLPVAIYRLEGSTWNRVARIPSDLSGFVTFDDVDVLPGRTYTYRIGVNPDGREEFYGLAAATTPPAPGFALIGPTPNPAIDALRVAFALPTREPVTIDVFDLGGRRVASYRDDDPPFGYSVINLGSSLGAGIYVVRLRQAALSASAKAVVIR